jgi:hypothetical protein
MIIAPKADPKPLPPHATPCINPAFSGGVTSTVKPSSHPSATIQASIPTITVAIQRRPKVTICDNTAYDMA